MTTVHTTSAPHRRRWMRVLAAVFGLAVVMAACDEDPEVTTADNCDAYLDQARWDEAIETCSQLEGDEGYSKTAQAYMGRAGIGLLALLEKIGESDQEGLGLMLSAFNVTPVQLQDVRTAIALLLQIEEHTTTDAFNLIVSTDVAISTLLKNELNISVDDDTGDIAIPGITDAGLEDLSSSSTAAEIQSTMKSIYSAHYYQKKPPVWDSSNPAILDLSIISSYVQGNAQGASLVELGDLSDLDFSASIDNGRCGLSSGQTASGVNNTSDGPKVAQFFPRRLNTSDSSTADNLADDLFFVLLDNAGNLDNTAEWKGTFLLPSRLLNPDFVGIDCGGGVAEDEFSACMTSGGPWDSVDFTDVTLSDLTTNLTCGGIACEANAAAGYPVTSADGNPAGADETGERAVNMRDLAEVLHQLYPVDNTDTSPSSTGLHCAEGDGYVHAREYDYYLRTLGL